MKKLLLALITSVLPNLVFAQTQCGQCHSTAVPLSSEHPNVQQLTATDCSKCHANNGKGIFQKVHESHKGKVPCNSCHLTNQNSVVLRQLSSGETISVSKDDFELYSELLSTDEGSASKLHLSKGLTCGSCHKESALRKARPSTMTGASRATAVMKSLQRKLRKLRNQTTRTAAIKGSLNAAAVMPVIRKRNPIV